MGKAEFEKFEYFLRKKADELEKSKQLEVAEVLSAQLECFRMGTLHPQGWADVPKCWKKHYHEYLRLTEKDQYAQYLALKERFGE